MVGVVNESFQMQEKSVHISDGPSSQQGVPPAKKKSGIILTSRNRIVIIGLSIVGVLAIAAVVVGTTVPNTNSEEDVTPHEKVAEPHSLKLTKEKSKDEHLTFDARRKPVDALARKNALKMRHSKHNRKHSKAAVDICLTPECSVSAANLIAAMDPTADPCEDFYQFACGGWYDSHPVTNQSLGTFYSVGDLVTERLDVVLNEPSVPSDPQPCRDARTHYATCLDTDTMNGLGIAPLWAQLSAPQQGGWPLVMDSWDGSTFLLEQALVFVEKLEVYPMIALGVAADFLNTSQNILYMIEGGLGTSSEFLLRPTDYPTELGFYKTYISSTAKLIRDGIGSSVIDQSIDQEVDDLVNFEISLAKAMQFIPTDPRDVLEKVDIAYLQNVTDSGVPGQFNWLAYFRILFAKTDVVISSNEPVYVAGEPFFPKFSTLLNNTSPRTLANYVGWWWVLTTGDATTYAMRDLSLQYLNSVYGTTSLYSSRASHCQVQTQYNLGMPTSRLYIDEFFPTESRAEVFQLVELIRAAFGSKLDENTWMTPGDVIDSEVKLAAIVDRVAYPDWIMNNAELSLAYNGLLIVAGEQYDNLIRMAEFFEYWSLETFQNPPNLGWPMPPTVVNAYYMPISNSITILAAIMQPPFYAQNSIAALNYGGMGMVIGHEMTHGFDDSGRHFDQYGNYANWWDQESIDAFNARAQCFVDQYNDYYPPELQGTPYSNMSVNGQQTLGENIADNGGIREAFLAYTNYVAQFGEEPFLPGLEEYSPYQLFFLEFGNLWCEHRTEASLIRQLESDPHSPGRFRIIGSLSNDDDFRTVWNCPAGSAMNRGNESCVLW